MKKLNHTNLVSLYEVLDDPTEDSLYMVMEMCKKGVVMKVGLDEKADSYPDENCRCWFRDMILAIEYLHAQGVVHRDIKPDNCLITDDDVLKVVDFGVSEMFEKEDDEMLTAKSAGSPAFLPPELCRAKHGDVSGKAADIWSMGVTLFCLKYGRIPFEKSGIVELYESIKSDEPTFETTDADFQDLMFRILDKDPATRIKMSQLRVRSHVTLSILHLADVGSGAPMGNSKRRGSASVGRGEHTRLSRAPNRSRNGTCNHRQYDQLVDSGTFSWCHEAIFSTVLTPSRSKPCQNLRDFWRVIGLQL